MSVATTPTAAPAAALHHAFLSVLPAVERHARVRFRHVRCPHRRADCVAEAVALAWAWFARLAARGTDATRFPSALAALAARAAHSGRRVAGQERARDVMSPVARRRHGLAIAVLPADAPGGPYADALADNTRSPVPEQAAFRADFPDWRRGFGPRDRALIDRLAAGERTADAARAFGVTPARVSQKRRQFRASWARHCGEVPG